MLLNILIIILVTVNAWFGWNRGVREGMVVVFLVPAVLGLIAAFTIEVPADAGPPWVFAGVFVVLVAVSLVSFVAARLMKHLMS